MTTQEQKQLEGLLDRAKEMGCYVKLEEYDHGTWHCFIYDDDNHGTHGEAPKAIDAVREALDGLAEQQR
ncbi:MAG: hypothetical protein H8E44_01325 [Planctomycetes bacterium]|nr:hypothetical protein [Planctomycetota bacterium]